MTFHFKPLNSDHQTAPHELATHNESADAVYGNDPDGYYKRVSGAAVLDAQGLVIARPSLAQILALGSGWHVEQAWSPSTRGGRLAVP